MRKVLNVDDNLMELAELFKEKGHKLYIVGGFVRNALMGFCETDIDICSSARVEDVEKILAGTRFSCVLINPALGTLHIFDQGKTVEYEHTTFRAERYLSGGVHSPSEVVFVDDIRADASRRDFSINALYYDILGQEILDFYDGIECIVERVVRTVETPDVVFSRDGLRILRLIRLASELNFAIDRATFDIAKKMVSQLGAISQERFNREIVAMIFADNKYQAVFNPGAQIRGVQLLGELGAWKYVLTAFYDTLNEEQQSKINCVEWAGLRISPPALRISAFLVDLFSALGITPTFELIDKVLGTKGIMLNKREIVRQSLILEAFFVIKSGALVSQKQIRLFLQKYYLIINELSSLCKLARIGGNLDSTYQLMITDHTPFCLRDLAINGDDISAEFPDISKIKYGEILNSLLSLCAVMPELNRRDTLLDTIPTLDLSAL